MKACYIESFGEIDVLKVGQLPDPKPEPGWVIIKSRAAALNHLDIWVRKGRPGKSIPMPHILGSDLAGIVKEIGKNVHGIQTGEEVIIYPGLFCGCCASCLIGEHSECAQYGLLGLSKPGTFAEYVTVPATSVFKKPQHLTFEEAAAFPLTYLTAWRMLFTRGKLKAGDTVLIHGIGGGVALAALSLARLAGARTIVTSSSKDKLDQAQQLGAHHTISYTEKDVVKTVMEITGNRGVDLIIDAVGAKTMSINLDMTRKGGTIVICGVTTGAKTELNLQALYWNQLNILGSTMGSAGEFAQLIQAVSYNNLKPVIDSVYAMDHIQEANARMENGEQFGKIVLRIA